ncbi:glutathione S-transferase [Elsinoe ampelina]|uniref:Glutathione S-transferase n=1 Tax=Elsinoe ampelina TaxID=302913 RepID=A0A6A6GP55_9PEZI|nr:glutathione S-transferase [Elsinoe ampelina]
MTLTIHHLQVSQSDRLVWLCEELSIPYTLVLHQRSPIFSPPSLYKLHPLGAAPIIQDGPITLAESAACAEYIIHKHGDGRLALPPSDPEYATYLYWFAFANGTLQPGVSRAMSVMGSGDTGSDNYRRVKGRLDGYLKHLDERLGGNEWLVGERFTAADVMTVFSVTTMRTFMPFSLAGYDGILAWLKRCSEREGFKRAKAKGDPELPLMIDADPPRRFTGLKL